MNPSPWDDWTDQVMLTREAYATLTKDAARYRFLRDEQETCCVWHSGLINLPNYEFDAAIDKARYGEAPK
jgi:hypothetical protein